MVPPYNTLRVTIYYTVLLVAVLTVSQTTPKETSIRRPRLQWGWLRYLLLLVRRVCWGVWDQQRWLFRIQQQQRRLVESHFVGLHYYWHYCCWCNYCYSTRAPDDERSTPTAPKRGKWLGGLSWLLLFAENSNADLIGKIIPYVVRNGLCRWRRPQ